MGTSEVLVVDDDPKVLNLMGGFLRGLGIEVRMARDGAEALQVFEAERPPLVITDLKMPGMDGLELMKAIKEASPQTEILIITAYADLGSAIQAVRQGAFDYLPKPFHLETLGRRVTQALECHTRYVTEQRRAEEEHLALEAQRKVDEAIRVIGGLAAGAAHDLNTLFTIIEGSARFLLEATPGGDPRRGDGERIYATAERGLRLVGRLLAIGSVNPGAVHPVNVARLFGEMLPALRSLMGDRIALNVRAARRLWRVRANPAHIEQLIMNLVANARDAMAADQGRLPGGTLTLEISNVAVDETSPPMAIEGLATGKYVMLVVRDTGCGMPPEVRSRVFEPFFTTKAPGKGTGLGLATVEWIVRRYNGHVACETEAGRGTTFRVYLPRGEKK
jgi:two-component system cell cycle sensor histidine kinase/response regulator CckA